MTASSKVRVVLHSATSYMPSLLASTDRWFILPLVLVRNPNAGTTSQQLAAQRLKVMLRLGTDKDNSRLSPDRLPGC